MKRTSMKNIKEIIKLSFTTDLSLRKIARATGVSRPVVTEYIDKFKKTGLQYSDIKDLNDDNLLEIIKKSDKTDKVRYAKLSSIFPYLTNELTKKHVTIIKLWEEYIEENPEGYSKSQFWQHFNTWRKKSDLIMHIEHKAGDKLFVDFTGKKLCITDKISGEKKEVETFVAILPASHYTYVCVTENQKTVNWIKGTEEAFWYFGGTPKAIVPDCYKSAVTKYDKYDPDINPEYRRFSEHYNTVILPARPMHPDDKALVENAVKLVYQWIYASLRNQVFYSIEELNNAILIQLDKYNAKKMQQSGLSRLELFENNEKKELAGLPISLYEPKKCSKATIQSNYHVLLSEDKHYYSVPYSFYGKSVCQNKKEKAEILYTEDTVEIYFKSERIAVHRRNKTKSGYSTKEEHMPENHKAFYERLNPEKIINHAKSKGCDVAIMIDRIMKNHKHPEQSYKTCKGIIYLSKTFGNERLNKACAKAMYFEKYSYRFVKEILINNQEDFVQEKELFDNLPEHKNIRGVNYYTNKIKENYLT